MPEPAKKRLAAIVFTDAVGSTRSMDLIEDRSVEAMRRELATVERIALSHDAHVVKCTGDGYLLWFESVTDAFAFAQALQSESTTRVRATKFADQFHHRVGIHFGEVAFADGDVFGSVVNLAQRVQSTAEPDGICFTQAVYEQIRGTPGVRIDALGPNDLKGVPTPVVLFHVGPKPIPKRDLPLPDLTKRTPKKPVRRRFWTASLGVISLAALGTVIGAKSEVLEFFEKLKSPPAATGTSTRVATAGVVGQTAAPNRNSPDSAPRAPLPRPKPRPVTRPEPAREAQYELDNQDKRTLKDFLVRNDFPAAAAYIAGLPTSPATRQAAMEASSLEKLLAWVSTEIEGVTEKDKAVRYRFDIGGASSVVGYYWQNGLQKLEYTSAEDNDPTESSIANAVTELSADEFQILAEALVARAGSSTYRKALGVYERWKSEY